MPPIGTGISGYLSILLLLSCLFTIDFSAGYDNPGAMMPVVDPGKAEMRIMLNDSRRKLGRFQECSLCICCAAASKSDCLPSPCCYAIDCNIPNRPFGFCSFTPKTCNCFGCNI